MSGKDTYSKTSKPIALVTGGNAGIGYETCKGLLAANYHVILSARSKSKADEAISKLLRDYSGDKDKPATAEPLVLDLSSLSSVRKGAEAFLQTGRSLDVCVLNAGVMALPWGTTGDKFEQQWQVNVLGHFLLFRLLLPAIIASGDGRIVHVSSGAHRLHPEPVNYDQLSRENRSEEGYNQWKAYGRSKLGNILLSDELARRLKRASDPEATKVTSNSLHPGSVSTALWSNIGRNNTSGLTPEEGAKTSIYLATSAEVEGKSGGYYFMCKTVTTLVDDEAHRNWSYEQKSATRTEISTSEKEGRKMWAVASRDVGIDEDLGL